MNTNQPTTKPQTVSVLAHAAGQLRQGNPHEAADRLRRHIAECLELDEHVDDAVLMACNWIELGNLTEAKAVILKALITL